MASARLNLGRVLDAIMNDDDDDSDKQKEASAPEFIPIGIMLTPQCKPRQKSDPEYIHSSSDSKSSDLDDDEVDDPEFIPDAYELEESGASDIDAECVEKSIIEFRKNIEKRLSRKRTRDPANWKANIRRRNCQFGKGYQDVKGFARPARQVKTKKDCHGKCKFQCSRVISDSERDVIHRHIWRLPDDRKSHFYAKFTERKEKARKRTLSNESRRKYSFLYSFEVNGTKHRVCKEFYLTTLDISQRRISYFYEHIRQPKTMIPRSPFKGKFQKRVIPEERKQSVRDHIKSIPKVESHYCRSSTQKEYLESTLNLKKLYEMYQEYCKEKAITPVEEHMYRHIYNYEFNIEFLKPKKDRCDRCEEYRNILSPAEEEKTKFEEHNNMKLETKEERDHDRFNPENIVICFDLENVISLPRANISSLFYKRKLSVYNLTAHSSIDKKGYCAIWSEGLSGRSGNDIASALIRILEKVIKRHPNIKDMILWSDSCGAQNRNSIMSTALKDFLQRNPSINSITQKLCEPGHSSIQEVDSVHSQIERTLKNCEVFSPVGLIRILLSVNRRNPLIVLQMKSENFFDYQSVSKFLNIVICHIQKSDKFNTLRLLHFTYYIKPSTQKTSMK